MYVYLSLEKDVALRWNNLNLIRSPKDALCQVWLKLVSGSREENILKIAFSSPLVGLLTIESPSPRNVLCQMMKLAEWF